VAVADVSFTVHEGEIFGILGPNGGPNGAGKLAVTLTWGSAEQDGVLSLVAVRTVEWSSTAESL
jgi:ABC-type Na+ transport system ATPase subunit NatA